MNFAMGMTPGTVLFLAGAATIAVAAVASLVTVFTAKRRRRKMEERMKEKY